MKKLSDLFLAELQDVYDAEHRITEALPQMEEAATDEALKEAFAAHLEETKGHIEKLEKVFALCEEKPKRKTCKATVGLLKEGADVADEFDGSPAINAALIAAAQKVEHYEMATYGSLREWAGLLGKKDAVEILAAILEEEEAADKQLTEVARAISNDEALSGEEEKAPKGRPAAAVAKTRKPATR